MRTSVAKIWIKLEVCLCTRPRGAWNKSCALFPASCVCDGPPKLRYWACQLVTMAMRGCSWAEVVFLTCAALTRQHVACASDSDSITLAGLVSPCTLNAACLCVKVERITILIESPALNWPCAVFASHHYNAIRCHGRDWRWEHARMHGSCRTLPSCGSSRAVVRGVGGVGTNAAQCWVTSECSGKVQTNRVSVARLITVKYVFENFE